MELIVVLVIALVVLGPKRLPEMGRSLGKGMREFKSSIGGEEREEHEVVDRALAEPAEPAAVREP